MPSVKVRINSAGAMALLSSPGVAADLSARAEAIAARACASCSTDKMRNDPYTANASKGGDRASASVVTSSTHGKRDNAKNNTLLKSLDAGR